MIPVYFSPTRSVSWNDNPNNANPIVNPTKLYIQIYIEKEVLLYQIWIATEYKGEIDIQRNNERYPIYIYRRLLPNHQKNSSSNSINKVQTQYCKYGIGKRYCIAEENCRCIFGISSHLQYGSASSIVVQNQNQCINILSK